LIKLYQNNGFPSVTELMIRRGWRKTWRPARCWSQLELLARGDRPAWGVKSEEAFIKFIRQGGGLVLLHAASATLQDWPEFQRMAGATWQLARRHGRIHTFRW
jgi:hypothetical protein